MLVARPTNRLCCSCSNNLLQLFIHGFGAPQQVPRSRGKSWIGHPSPRFPYASTRRFAQINHLRADVEPNEPIVSYENVEPRTPEQMEAIARQARQTFGETLPQGFLSHQEYQIYERLYGAPSAPTSDEDIDLLAGVEAEGEEIVEGLPPRNVLMREGEDGKLEEIVYEDEEFPEESIERDVEGPAEDIAESEEDLYEVARAETQEEFHARVERFRVAAAERTAASRAEQSEVVEEEAEVVGDGETAGIEVPEQNPQEEERDAEGEGDPYDHGDLVRTHPLTAAGRSGTSPGTIFLPKDLVLDPVSAILANASNKHISEAAHKSLGGPGLPNSTATIKRPNLKQEPIGLESSQASMGEMEGNAFLAAIMPGAYTSVYSSLVETRKRLGSQWLRDLMRKQGGPRILDAGGGGAGVLAWRQILRAEWETLYPNGVPHDKPPPYGRSTVVTGSAVLRHKASKLLDNTTFIPRLPDYDPSRDHPSLEGKNPQPRKQYDIIVAPHTLWTLKEDYMRKSQIQNFWSLLDPRGGVLILIEKGIPRGFELIAGARETLLKHHISSPGSEAVEHSIEDASENRFGPKEKGMIIAPCTSHGRCPMYITSGKTQGRKDFCHFSQRFIRPPYLQRILNAKDRNHEDVRFSYVALQRGVDLRRVYDFEQGHPATEAAFKGHEEAYDISSGEAAQPGNPSTLTFPRAILPPIKRRGHVTLDLCTPSGKIERWTVPKSFSKQAYRDARKSKWGDLWALGAKTRVQRNIRVGLDKPKSQVKNVEKEDLGNASDDFGSEEVDEDMPRSRRGSKKMKYRKRAFEIDDM